MAEVVRLGHSAELLSSESLEKQSFDPDAEGALAKARTVQGTLWSRAARRSVQDVVSRFEPDVIHYHSIYHQLSAAAVLKNVPTVMTLHDYKLAAPCYVLYRDGGQCTLCVGRRVSVPAVRYACVRDSHVASLVCTIEELAHRRRYLSMDRFIVPSTFARDIMVRAGYPAEKLSVVRWSAGEPAHAIRPSSVRGRRFVLYAGRLSEEKGIRLLLDSWSMSRLRSKLHLVIAGDGPMRSCVDEAARVDPSVVPLGFVDTNQVAQLMGEAELLVQPSVCPETFGLVIAEALSAGTPVVSTGLGALSDFRGPGVATLDEVSAPVLARALDRYCDEQHRLEMQQAARGRSATLDSPSDMANHIVSIYEDVRRASGRRPS